MFLNKKVGLDEKSINDNKLLIEVVNGNVTAFNQLYHQYNKCLFTFILRFVKQRDIVEEVINDVMFTVWEKAHSFEGGSKVSTWIFGIAYHKSLRAIQKSKRDKYNYSIGIEDDYMNLDPSVCPETCYIEEEFVSRYKNSLQRLSNEQREVIELSVRGHSYNDIANIMTCPENTVKTRIFHARKRLKRFSAMRV